MSRDLTNALHELMQQNQANIVQAQTARGAAPKAKSTALLPGGGAASGVLNNLTETNYAAREYYAAGWATTDGLFVMPAIKKVTFTDPNNATYVLNFAQPT